MKQLKKIIVISAALLVVAGAVVLFSGGDFIFAKTLTYEAENKQISSLPGMDNVLKLQDIYRNIAKSLMPAVVSINVESVQVVQNPYNQFFNDPFFRQFFGDQGGNAPPKEYKRKLQAMGSGFIITKDGYLFSNYHVVQNATRIVVILSDNRQFEAKVVGTDPQTDIALLKINANNLPVAPLGDSSDLQVGDIVMAIGNPFGLSGTYTSGIVSAIGRPGMTSGYQKLIQTDAAVNPGNSGGPLVNIKGQVIAINSAIQTQSGGFEGISFAVPINIAKGIAEQLVEKGKVTRGYLGINISDIDATTRKSLGLTDNEGVMISQVEKGGAADKGNLKKGDIITRVNGDMVGTSGDLQAAIGSIKPGDNVTLEVFRDKKKSQMIMKVGEKTEQPSTNSRVQNNNGQSEQPSETFDFLGTTFATASQSVLDKNGADYGVVVTEVGNNSALSDAVDTGYIIIGINNTVIKNLTDLKNFAARNKNETSFTLLIVNNGLMFYRGVEK